MAVPYVIVILPRKSTYKCTPNAPHAIPTWLGPRMPAPPLVCAPCTSPPYLFRHLASPTAKTEARSKESPVLMTSLPLIPLRLLLLSSQRSERGNRARSIPSFTRPAQLVPRRRAAPVLLLLVPPEGVPPRPCL